MPNTPYLIVGGGLAADAAVRGIRDVDPDGAIALVGAEPDPPYKRPYLSKKLWTGKPLDAVWTHTDRLGAELYLGRSVRWLDLRAKVAVDDRGTVYGYDKLLLATGARPRRLPTANGRVVHFRSLQDYRRLRSMAEEGERFAVVGGGFVGSEIAAALAANGKEVVMLFPGDGIGDRVFPADLAGFLTGYYRERGIDVRPQTTVVGIDSREDGLILRTESVERRDMGEFPVDGVVAGIGTEPNVELAQAAGLAVDDGVVVDEFLRTSHPDVYAAGDVASFCLHPFGERRRVEHEDNATTMGRFAGRAMAGDPAPYHHIPFFYSDLFDLGYEAVGEVDARLDTVADWKEPHREGTLYYLRDRRVRGVLLWNVWEHVDAARRLIAEPDTAGRDDLIGRLSAAA